LDVITYAPSNVQCFALTSSSPSKRHSCLDIQHNDSRTQQSPTSSDIDNIIHKLISHLDEEKQQEVYPMLLKHRTLFNLSKMTIANTQIRHVIRTDDHNPISSRLYSKTIQQQQILAEHIQQMEKNYLIRRSTSPWASPDPDQIFGRYDLNSSIQRTMARHSFSVVPYLFSAGFNLRDK
ncbi:unnamed protein product, partial [Didymodactylos carnosus]